MKGKAILASIVIFTSLLLPQSIPAHEGDGPIRTEIVETDHIASDQGRVRSASEDAVMCVGQIKKISIKTYAEGGFSVASNDERNTMVRYTGYSGFSINGFGTFYYNYDISFQSLGEYVLNFTHNSTGEIIQYVVRVTNHNWGDESIVTQPTCSATGVARKVCTICGKNSDRVLDKTPHTWGSNYTVDTAPTCAEVGYESIHCTVCGEKDPTTERELPKNDQHKWTIEKVDVEATCVNPGMKHRECEVCGAKEAATEIPATNKHNYSDYVITKAPTVLKKGTKARTCQDCGIIDSVSLKKLKPTAKLNATKVILQKSPSTSKLQVSGLAEGDYVKSWKSGNTKLVTVNKKGKLTAKKKTGKTTVTATLASGLKKKITVVVQSNKVSTTKISDLPTEVILKKGDKDSIEPVIIPFTSQDGVTYSTSNSKVATISSKGIISAKNAGKATITVVSGKKKCKIAVTVKK